MLRQALIALVAFAAAAPAAASTYSAALAKPTDGRIIGRDIVWACGPAACQGASDYGQPVALCQSLAKRAGRVERFVANGRALSADQLARCNTAAKVRTDAASAND